MKETKIHNTRGSCSRTAGERSRADISKNVGDNCGGSMEMEESDNIPGVHLKLSQVLSNGVQNENHCVQKSCQDVFANYTSMLNTVATRDAKIQELERNLEIILDENNLLQLEMQDMQNEMTEVEKLRNAMEARCLENQNLQVNYNILRSAVLELFNLLEGSSVLEQDNIKTVMARVIRLINPTLSSSAASTDPINGEKVKNKIDNNNVEGKEGYPAEKTPDSMPKLAELIQTSKLTGNSTQTLSKEEKDTTVLLRRSQRKSVIASQIKLEIIAPPDSASATPPDVAALPKPVSLSPPFPKVHTPAPPPPHSEILQESSEDKDCTQQHAADASKGEGFHCICGRQYLTKQKLRLHVRQFTCDWKFECKMCGSKFFEGFKLRTHMQHAHNKHITETLGCYYCGTLFETRKELFRHQKEKHNCGPFCRQDETCTNSIVPRKRRVKNGKMLKAVLKDKKGISKAQKILKTAKTSKIPKSNIIRKRVTKQNGVEKRKQKEDDSQNSIPILKNENNADDSKRTTNLNAVHKIDNTVEGYSCICGSAFTSKTGLNVHVKYFTYEAKFACTNCDRKFFSTCLLRAHMKSRHNIIFTGKDGCRRCGICFPSRLLLYKHCKTVHKCGPLMPNSKKSSPSVSPEPPVLERQDTVEETEIISPVENATEEANKTKRNVKSKQRINTKSFTRKRAEVKGTRVRRKSVKTNHDDVAVIGLANDAQCDNLEGKNTPKQEENTRTPSRNRKTPNKYEDFSSVTRIKKFHLEVTPMKNEDKGNAKKEAKSPLKNTNGRKKKSVPPSHMATEGTRNSTEVKCICGKDFATKSALLSHVKLKTRGNIFKCSVCSEGFPRMDYLRRHLLMVHERNKVTKPQQQNNKKPKITTFATKKKKSSAMIALISRSKKVKNGIIKKPSKIRPAHGKASSRKKDEFKCLCGRQFVREVTLNEHLRLKIGKRVFACESCPESFARYDYFKEHARRAHQLIIEGMACRKCGARGFPTHVELNKHRLEAHVNKTKSTKES